MTAEMDAAPQGLRTMIVAASSLFAWRLAGALEAFGVGQVETADHAEGALALLCRDRFDLVLLMHQPPDLDGIDFVRRLHSLRDASSRDCHVVMITPMADAECLRALHQVGIDQVSVGGPSPPWLRDTIEGLRRRRERWSVPQWELVDDEALL
ncbi:Response regulator receiver domain-containing protein [Arboricoccus pini]|uniref:Response regulator receiver domain-containing protein n=1 Tax=Arboricoccus pini TaxID=1963835 RepID=A0A212S265_9PROT|nr:response regulator [Arboricoccus pini]SNB79230.1 Response regulator receiver domain-containing protein [Arboricoccus pini]